LGLILIEKDGAVPELMRVLKETGNNATRGAIVSAFTDLHRPSDTIIDALVEIYRDDSIHNEVRARAIAGLGVLIDPRPIPVSAQLIRLYNYFIRSHALDEVATWM
jgi:HEAT repeat protein